MKILTVKKSTSQEYFNWLRLGDLAAKLFFFMQIFKGPCMPHFCTLSFSDADLLGLPGYDTGALSQELLLEHSLQRISQLICQERKADNDQTERLDRKLQSFP